jgi:outer membrane lipase/esterase
MIKAKPKQMLSIAITLALAPAAWAGNFLDFEDGKPDTKLRALVNPTQTNMADLISRVCPSGNNEAQFQARCDAFFGFADEKRLNPNDPQKWRPGYAGALQQISPEQFISQGTVATRSAGNIIGSRLAALRLGARGFNVAGLNFKGQNAMNFADRHNVLATGGAAGDESAPIWNRLGLFFNGMGTFGDVEDSPNQVGFDFRSAGITAGGDYRFSESLIVGAAFTYLRMESDFNPSLGSSNSRGSLNSDSYSGSIYATYYLPNGFYVDGLGTIGGLNYDSIRNINYTLLNQTNGKLFDSVNSAAVSNPGGKQYVASIGLGYNQNFGGINVSPYLRGNYNRLEVDGFDEQGGAGMAVGFGDQTVESVTSVLGAQLSYAVSTVKGVFTPYIHGEWRHEFEDSGRVIPVRFLGNTSSPSLTFGTLTDSPDRNYFNLGAGVSATFAHGISGFLNYDTLLGYSRITSHALMAGARFEF